MSVAPTIALLQHLPIDFQKFRTPYNYLRYNHLRHRIALVDFLLKHLGYAVETVSSGEEAMVFMDSNTADLVVLDMIMPPGMDGLDTYKNLIAIHPEQKAIIASGFSETDRVKKAQQLGAGKYVKKPYTMEKIGLAVKDELGKSQVPALMDSY